MNREQLMHLQMVEQEANQLNQQFQLIEQNITEMQELHQSLSEINQNKDENTEILVNLGKRIYLPVKIKEKKLTVEVGDKNFVKKTIPETKETIEEQIKKLIAGKTEIMERLQDLEIKMNGIIQKINQESKSGKNEKHEYDENSEHE